MRAGNDFTQCRTGRGLAASRRPFGDARLPVRHCAAGAEVPSRHQTTQPKNEVLTSDRDLTIVRSYILVYEIDRAARLVRVLRLFHESENYSDKL